MSSHIHYDGQKYCPICMPTKAPQGESMFSHVCPGKDCPLCFHGIPPTEEQGVRERLNKRFFGGIPTEEMGSNQVDEKDLLSFIEEEVDYGFEAGRLATLTEVEGLIEGMRKEIVYDKYEKCPYCNGPHQFSCSCGSVREDALSNLLEALKKMK